jgi:hypothetical protein
MTKNVIIDGIEYAPVQKQTRTRAKLAAAKKDHDNWKAHAISRGKRLRRARDRFINIRDEIEDEGDRVYFGSSNHADQFKEEVAWLDDFSWDKIMGEPENWDLLGVLEKARAELAASRECLQYLMDNVVSRFIVEEDNPEMLARIDAAVKGE